jgi:hypothetical protein
LLELVVEVVLMMLLHMLVVEVELEVIEPLVMVQVHYKDLV